MDSGLRLQQFCPQVSDGHLLLLKRSEVLLGVWGSDAMVVPTQVVGSCSSAEHGNTSGKGRVSLFLSAPTHQKHFEMKKSKLVILVKPGITVWLGITGMCTKGWFSSAIKKKSETAEKNKLSLTKKLIALTFRCPLYAL